MNKKQIINTVKVITLALVFSVGVQYVAAQTTWTSPTSAPPGGNTFAPLNVGSSGQVKDGGLTLNAAAPGATFGLIIPNGKLGIGNGVNNPALNTDANTSAVKFQIFGSGSQRLKVQSTDTFGARIDLQNQKSTGGPNAWHIQAYQDSFQVVESGVAPRVSVVPGGNVAVGFDPQTSAPREKLDVAGNIYIRSGGSLIMPTNAGTGKVLVSDANGRGTWSSPLFGKGMGTRTNGQTIPLPSGFTDQTKCVWQVSAPVLGAEGGNQGIDLIEAYADNNRVVTCRFSYEDNGAQNTTCNYIIMCSN